MVHVLKSLSATWHLSRVCLSLQFGSGNATFENTWNSIQQRQTRNAYWSYNRNRGSEYDPLIGLVDSFRVYASENYTCDVIARPVLDLWRIKRATWDRTASSCQKRRWRYVMQCEPCRHIRGVWSTSWTFWPERTVSRHWQVRVWMKGSCLPACVPGAGSSTTEVPFSSKPWNWLLHPASASMSGALLGSYHTQFIHCLQVHWQAFNLFIPSTR